MGRRGEFPRRFNMTPRCVVWDFVEVKAWLAARRQASNADTLKLAEFPGVRQRRRKQRGRICATPFTGEMVNL
ncbi:helix-turn-helix transcriptional regulator [Undibacterium sp. CCC3.4]|uniref:helix-turn-helix transcriptional regulator n=1 Tax=Undibacterium sp. CCC3.4 TaxID=3048609 RepID=UPI003A1002A9